MKESILNEIKDEISTNKKVRVAINGFWKNW